MDTSNNATVHEKIKTTDYITLNEGLMIFWLSASLSGFEQQWTERAGWGLCTGVNWQKEDVCLCRYYVVPTYSNRDSINFTPADNKIVYLCLLDYEHSIQ